MRTDTNNAWSDVNGLSTTAGMVVMAFEVKILRCKSENWAKSSCEYPRSEYSPYRFNSEAIPVNASFATTDIELDEKSLQRTSMADLIIRAQLTAGQASSIRRTCSTAR